MQLGVYCLMTVQDKSKFFGLKPVAAFIIGVLSAIFCYYTSALVFIKPELESKTTEIGNLQNKLNDKTKEFNLLKSKFEEFEPTPTVYFGKISTCQYSTPTKSSGVFGTKYICQPNQNYVNTKSKFDVAIPKNGEIICPRFTTINGGYLVPVSPVRINVNLFQCQKIK